MDKKTNSAEQLRNEPQIKRIIGQLRSFDEKELQLISQILGECIAYIQKEHGNNQSKNPSNTIFFN